MIRTETMNAEFSKLHLEVGTQRLTLHHFTGPDVGDFHDHPFPFTTSILSGGYIEEVMVRVMGQWSCVRVRREPGTTHRVEATDIHRIVELPAGECVTSVIWHSEGLERRPVRFWRMRQGVMQSRRFDQPWNVQSRQTAQAWT